MRPCRAWGLPAHHGHANLRVFKLKRWRQHSGCLGKGGKVTWTNNDPVPHTVTSTFNIPSGATSFDSGNMNQNATYTVTFTVAGTYQYTCTYHPWMHGTVVVTG